MSSRKYEYAVRLLKEMGCPEPIMNALWLWGLTVREDEIKLQNWIAPGGVIEGEAREVTDRELEAGGQ